MILSYRYMKIKLNVLALLFLIPQLFFAQNYYYKGKKIDINLDITRVNISTYSDFQLSSISHLGFEILTVIYDNKTIDGQNLKFIKLAFQTPPSEVEFYQKVNVLKNNTKIRNVTFYYNNGVTESIGTSNIFYVKLKSETDYNVLEQIALQKNVDILHQNQFMPNWYKLGLKPKSLKTSIELSSEFFETNLFDAIDPAFIFDFSQNCSNDPAFDQMWGLKNTINPDIDINICQAWNITQGNNVNVAVVDQGVELDHIDLYSNIHPLSFDTANGSMPSLIYGDHGTHVAGTIVAIKDNNLQVVGVAPDSQLMSVSNELIGYPEISEDLANGINWAWENGADVISNSWGGGCQAGYDALYSEMLEESIINAMSLGRNGRGCIVLFSTGNKPNCSVGYPAFFHPDILCVGAINQTGERWLGSSYGEELDVIAPGDNILSTILNNETGYKSGTSMATPHVAGIAALLLSVNPCLSGEQVRDIIEATSQKVGSYDYDFLSERPNGTWNEEMGYGLVDAYSAVQLAVNLNSPTLDLFVKDTNRDLGIEPNNIFVEYMWNSPDIWVRNQADGIETHQNPEYDPNNPNYVYIRVINKSCATSTVNEELKLYWAKANTGLSWPNNWNGTYYEDGVLMGDEIGSIQIPILAPGEETIVEFEWNVPNPDDYSGIAESLWNFSLLTRIVSNEDTMTFPEGRSTYKNVVKNNNIALKNLLIVNFDSHNISHLGGVVAISNPFDVVKSFKIELIKEETENGKAIYDESEVRVKLDNNLFNSW